MILEKITQKDLLTEFEQANWLAAEMALQGLKPWVYTPFLIERPFEQVKLDIDQQKANVKFVGFADYPS